MKQDPRWWLLDEDDPDARDGAWKKVMTIVRALDDDCGDAKQRMARAARLYDPYVEIVGVHMDISVGPWPMESRGPVTMNIIKSCVDTVTSMVAKNRPRAVFLTDNADYTLAERAKDLDRFVEAEFERTDVYEDAVRMFRDATMVGLGVLKVTEYDGKPSVERVLAWDIVPDQTECLAGPPRQIHQLRFVDRDILKAMFPDYEDQISAVSADDRIRRWTDYRQVESEMIPVVESWRLPSEPGARDGIHALCMDGCTLEWEPWKHDYFPFVFYRWNERQTGFWGVGLIEELAGMQNKVNKINWHITRCHDLSNSYVVVQSVDAGISVKASAGPDPLQLLPFKGTVPPQFVIPPMVQPELYQHLIFLVAQMYKVAGISELSAHSEMPKGLESAIAIQTFSDIETQRFSIQSQRLERCYLHLARQMIRLMQRIGGKKYEARWRSRNLSRTIKWQDVEIDESMYSMKIEAASIQSRTPSGQIQAAVELGNAGLLEKDELRRLIDHPDLRRSMTLANANTDHAEAICERLSRGQYSPPEAGDGLEVCLKYVTQAFWTMKDRDAPEYILDGFRMWQRQAIRELKKQVPTAPPMDPNAPPMDPNAMPPPSAPGGMPEMNSPEGALA